MLTDNGASYRNRAFAAVLERLGARHRWTRPYRPQTIGKAERFNGSRSLALDLVYCASSISAAPVRTPRKANAPRLSGMAIGARPRLSEPQIEPRHVLDQLDLRRLELIEQLDPTRRAAFGQFMTPATTARLMAKMFRRSPPQAVRMLDAGAGMGSLTTAYIAEMCSRSKRPSQIEVTAYELDRDLAAQLRRTLELCARAAKAADVRMDWEVIEGDFIADSVARLDGGWLAPPLQQFNAVILNPPYKKLSSTSGTRMLLRQVGIETSNLYTAFVAVAARLLEPNGELVAITPRSFCNGRYFRPFRLDLLARVAFERLHVFEARDRAFREDGVLQENIIFHAVAGPPSGPVYVSSSAGPDDEDVTTRAVPRDDLVRPDDPEHFIHIAPGGLEDEIATLMSAFTATLMELDLEVSTGRVVDFRALDHLRADPGPDTAPLLYPSHLREGRTRWPLPGGRKPNAIATNETTEGLLVPAGTYVLVKRFTAKEERRRVVASVVSSADLPGLRFGFENHLNYYHQHGEGLPLELAAGLAAFLNSSLVDAYIRQFSGHTQINATDLRSLHYPTREELTRLGRRVGRSVADQTLVDRTVEEGLLNMTDGVSALRAADRISESLAILTALGFPRAQRNARSALTLLALADIRPDTPWASASDPLRGIRPMMDWMRDHDVAILTHSPCPSAPHHVREVRRVPDLISGARL